MAIVNIWEKLFKKVMFAVHCSPKQTFVVVFSELSGSGVSFSIEIEPDTPRDKRFDALLV